MRDPDSEFSVFIHHNFHSAFILQGGLNERRISKWCNVTAPWWISGFGKVDKLSQDYEVEQISAASSPF